MIPGRTGACRHTYEAPETAAANLVTPKVPSVGDTASVPAVGG
jgi:hypothetical protein